MSIVNSIETVRDWLTAEVCPLVKLKLPDDKVTDASYPYKLVNPRMGRDITYTAPQLQAQAAQEQHRLYGFDGIAATIRAIPPSRPARTRSERHMRMRQCSPNGRPNSISGLGDGG